VDLWAFQAPNQVLGSKFQAGDETKTRRHGRAFLGAKRYPETYPTVLALGRLGNTRRAIEPRFGYRLGWRSLPHPWKSWCWKKSIADRLRDPARSEITQAPANRKLKSVVYMGAVEIGWLNRLGTDPKGAWPGQPERKLTNAVKLPKVRWVEPRSCSDVGYRESPSAGLVARLLVPRPTSTGTWRSRASFAPVSWEYRRVAKGWDGRHLCWSNRIWPWTARKTINELVDVLENQRVVELGWR